MSQSGKTTLRDVAKRAGVTAGTVSRAINGSPLVNELTRDRIMSIVEELNYSPNLVARRLSIGKTMAIAVVVPFFTRPSVVIRLSGVVQSLAQTTYDLVIHNIEQPDRRHEGFLDVLRPERVDGALIISWSLFPQDVEEILTSNIPTVLIDTNQPALKNYHQIFVDDVEGGVKATEYLLGLGHEKIGFIGDPVENPFRFHSSYHRMKGYVATLEAAGIAYRESYVERGEHDHKVAKDLAVKMLSQPAPPTAILAASDTQAMGVLQAARELDLHVPKDLSVMGYDDIQAAEFVELTTVRQELYESGRLATRLLLETLDAPEIEPVHQMLPTTIIERKTTAPPPQ